MRDDRIVGSQVGFDQLLGAGDRQQDFVSATTIAMIKWVVRLEILGQRYVCWGIKIFVAPWYQ